MWWGIIWIDRTESSNPLIILGRFYLAFTKDRRLADHILRGSWRRGYGVPLNVWGATLFMQVPWYYQFLYGEFLVSWPLITDPVTASATPTGKWSTDS